MILKQISYLFETNNKSYDDWVLDDVVFQNLNLVVGTNSTGKSRLVIVIKSFANMILQNSKAVYSGIFRVKFYDPVTKEIINYEICRANGKITETLLINDQNILQRENEFAKVYDYEKEGFISISPPLDKLVLHVRRDVRAYPFFESLVNWSENVHFFNFGKIHSTSFLSDSDKDEAKQESNISKELDKYLSETKKNDFLEVIQELLTIDFKVESIRYSENTKSILIKEEGFKTDYTHHNLSQGIFRSLALLFFIKSLDIDKRPSCVLIDDFCEGLDYNRSNKLGRLLFDKFEIDNVQLIATSNDSFLMNAVPIKYWNILIREKHNIKSYSYENSKDKFEQFDSYGLNNFDLFTSDFLQE